MLCASAIGGKCRQIEGVGKKIVHGLGLGKNMKGNGERQMSLIKL